MPSIRQGVALHEHAVRVGTAVTLVGVADDVLLVGVLSEDSAPLDAGREARPAAAAQAGRNDFFDDLDRGHG